MNNLNLIDKVLDWIFYICYNKGFYANTTQLVINILDDFANFAVTGKIISIIQKENSYKQTSNFFYQILRRI